MAGGSFAGPLSVVHDATAKPGKVSDIAGISGAMGERCSDVTAMARTLLAGTSAKAHPASRRLSIVRLVTGHGNAMAVAAVGKVIEQGMMLGTAIVPASHRIGLPLKAHA